jgi:hydroxymethylglutaryl-CoA lyase
MLDTVTVVETPRDAFQGLSKFIPTPEKIKYIKAVLEAGIKHVDLGSFVSPKAVPQMSDSDDVVRTFNKQTDVERIAIVVNGKGVQRAIEVGGLDAIGFPFSLSRDFQLHNTKLTSTQTWPLVEQFIIQTELHDMSFILYLSMAFGNPYNEPWDEQALLRYIKSLAAMGVRHVSLADTVAVAKPDQVKRVFTEVKREFPEIEFSAHFHGRPHDWFACVDAALEAGCRRFDSACGGLGGCPFAQDKLVANIPTDGLVQRLERAGFKTGVNVEKIQGCAKLARELQQQYG